MTMEAQFRALDEVELLEFFGVEPVARTAEDGYWCYEISDARGVTLRFSFDLFERSVQTALSLGGSHIATVSHEGADRMLVREGKLRCEFSTAGEKTTLTIETGRSLSVSWSSLRTE
jgi:hypothetical protein